MLNLYLCLFMVCLTVGNSNHMTQNSKMEKIQSQIRCFNPRPPEYERLTSTFRRVLLSCVKLFHINLSLGFNAHRYNIPSLHEKSVCEFSLRGFPSSYKTNRFSKRLFSVASSRIFSNAQNVPEF